MTNPYEPTLAGLTKQIGAPAHFSRKFAQFTQRWGSWQTGCGKTIWAEQVLPPV